MDAFKTSATLNIRIMARDNAGNERELDGRTISVLSADSSITRPLDAVEDSNPSGPDPIFRA